MEENYIWKEHGYAHSAKPQMKIRINVLCAGMDYASAVIIYKKYSTEKIEKEKVIKKSPTETKKKSVDTSKIKLHFKDEDTVITKTPPPKEKNVYAIISIVVGIIGMLLSILVNPLGLLMAGTGIALGIVSVKNRN